MSASKITLYEKEQESCDGCFFMNTEMCDFSNCKASKRKDSKNVIFVEDKDKDKDVNFASCTLCMVGDMEHFCQRTKINVVCNACGHMYVEKKLFERIEDTEIVTRG